MGMITDILKELPLNAVLRDKLQTLEKKYDGLEAENDKLKKENRDLKEKLGEFTDTSELDELEVKILILLSSTNREFTANMIGSSLDLSLTKTEYYLERMYNEYVCSRDWTNRPSDWYLIQKGRGYLIKNDLLE